MYVQKQWLLNTSNTKIDAKSNGYRVRACNTAEWRGLYRDDIRLVRTGSAENAAYCRCMHTIPYAREYRCSLQLNCEPLRNND